jgi:uncharacterized protein (TIGR00266 family)
METKHHFNPSFGMIELALEPGESAAAETGALVAKDASITLTTKARGGILSSLKRAVLGGESFFVNTFTCAGAPGRLFLAPAADGSVAEHELRDEAIFLQSGAFLASTGAVEFDTKWGGAKTFFSREGLFVLRAHGTGKIFFNSFGAIHRVDLKNQSTIVDTGFLVAWSETLSYQVTKVGGLKNFFFSGEGLVCRLAGTGTVWIQTRSPDALAAFLHPFRRVETRRSR